MEERKLKKTTDELLKEVELASIELDGGHAFLSHLKEFVEEDLFKEEMFYKCLYALKRIYLNKVIIKCKDESDQVVISILTIIVHELIGEKYNIEIV